jgi:hypothetical protein
MRPDALALSESTGVANGGVSETIAPTLGVDISNRA